jgi:hypothetical protein
MTGCIQTCLRLLSSGLTYVPFVALLLLSSCSPLALLLRSSCSLALLLSCHVAPLLRCSVALLLSVVFVVFIIHRADAHHHDHHHHHQMIRCTAPWRIRITFTLSARALSSQSTARWTGRPACLQEHPATIRAVAGQSRCQRRWVRLQLPPPQDKTRRASSFVAVMLV